MLSQLATLTYHAHIEFQRALHFMKHRLEPLLSSFAETGHPANKFTMDYLIKLQNNKDVNIKELYEVLQKFTMRHYSAHRMKLVIRVTLLKSNFVKTKIIYYF